MRLPVKLVFARVTDDTVEAVITLAACGWFAVALLQIVTVAFAAAGGALAGGDLVDPIVSALGGWFLIKTKSRGVAGALLLFAAVMMLLFVLKAVGASDNGVPLITALVALWAGWRGWTGAKFWQTRACAIIDWKQVSIGAAIAAVVTLIGLIVLKIALAGTALPGALAEFLLTGVLFLVPVGVLIAFTRRRHFARNDPACPWPRKD